MPEGRVGSFRQSAIPEMARVLRPGGALLIANLNSFNTACGDQGWIKDSDGKRLHYPIDNYLQERTMWIEYRGIRVVNHHRPMSTYLRALIGAGLVLTYFDEPAPHHDAPASRAASYRRLPWFLVMEWLKPVPASGERSDRPAVSDEDAAPTSLRRSSRPATG